MNRSRIHFVFMSFLDLICCGFGAATLLFLLAIVSVGEHDVAPSENTIVVRAHQTGQSAARARAEIGIEYLPPGGKVWRRAGSNSTYGDPVIKEATFFTATSADAPGGEAFAVFSSPQSGFWRFRTYLVDFPGPNGGHADFDLSIYGRHEEISREASSTINPGDYGHIVTIWIARD